MRSAIKTVAALFSSWMACLFGAAIFIESFNNHSMEGMAFATICVLSAVITFAGSLAP